MMGNNEYKKETTFNKVVYLDNCDEKTDHSFYHQFCKKLDSVSFIWSNGNANIQRSVELQIEKFSATILLDGKKLPIKSSTISLKYNEKKNHMDIFISENMFVDAEILKHSDVYDDNEIPRFFAFYFNDIARENLNVIGIKFILNGIEIGTEDLTEYSSDLNESLILLVDNTKYCDGKNRYIILANDINNLIERFDKQCGYMKIKLKDDDVISIINNSGYVEVSITRRND